MVLKEEPTPVTTLSSTPILNESYTKPKLSKIEAESLYRDMTNEINRRGYQVVTINGDYLKEYKKIHSRSIISINMIGTEVLLYRDDNLISMKNS